MLGADLLLQLVDGNSLDHLYHHRHHQVHNDHYHHLLRGYQDLVQTRPLLRPVLPGVLVTQPDQDGSVHSDGLEEDQRPVQRD